MMEFVQSWPAFIGFIAFFLAVVYFYFRISRKKGFGEFSVGISYRDLYAFILVVVPVTAMMAYFVMSLGLGKVMVGGQPVYWIRYFEWAVTTPLLVLGVMILTQKAELSVRMMLIDVLMILTGLAAAITTSGLSIGFFVLSSAFFAYLVYAMIAYTGDIVYERPKAISVVYKRLRNVILGVWSAYPILYLLGNRGTGILTFEQTNTVFLVLDLSAKIGFAFVVLLSLEQVDDFELDMDLEGM